MPNNISSNAPKKVCYPLSFSITTDEIGTQNIYNMKRLVDARLNCKQLRPDQDTFLGTIEKRPLYLKVNTSWCEWINVVRSFQLGKEAQVMETDYLELLQVASLLPGPTQIDDNRKLQREVKELQDDFRQLFESTVIPPHPGAREAFAQRLDSLLMRVRLVQEHLTEQWMRQKRNLKSREMSGQGPQMADNSLSSTFAPPAVQDDAHVAPEVQPQQDFAPNLRRRIRQAVEPTPVQRAQFGPRQGGPALELTPEQQEGLRRAIDKALKYQKGNGFISAPEELRLRAGMAEAMEIDPKLHPIRNYKKGSLNYANHDLQTIAVEMMNLMSPAQRNALERFLRQAYPDQFGENFPR